jgi:hypothetical protein
MKWNIRIYNTKNNNITLYIEVPMCGLVIQMVTFMMYDSIRSVISLCSSTASCYDCYQMDEMKEQLKNLVEERRILGSECANDLVL